MPDSRKVGAYTASDNALCGTGSAWPHKTSIILSFACVFYANKL